MGHVPHLLLEGPWKDDRLPVTAEQRHHLERVLRVSTEGTVSYTDGAGISGVGVYVDGAVARGEEHDVARPSEIVVVSAVPSSRERLRFLVEKLSEMGVAELRFLTTRYGNTRPARIDRLHSWAAAGLEQSRGAWLMTVSEDTVTLGEIEPPYAVCDMGGSRDAPYARTVVIGPEGGWAPGEIPPDATRYDLGDTVLRVETAAIVAAARFSGRLERPGTGN